MSICVYVYEREEITTKAKHFEVKYTKKCDTDYVNHCVAKEPAYGKGPAEPVCKETTQETCYNRPLVRGDL